MEQIKIHLSFIRKESSPAGEPGTASFQHAQCQVNLQREARAWLGDTVVGTWGRTMACPQATGSLPYSVHRDADRSWCVKLPTSPECLTWAAPPVLMEMSACPTQNTVLSVTSNHNINNNITYICSLLCVGTEPRPACVQVIDKWEHPGTVTHQELAGAVLSFSQSTNTSFFL